MTLKQLADYGTPFQRKVIGALMTDQKFVINVRDVIKLEYFNSQAHKWIVQRILDYFDSFHTVPTLEVLQIEFKKIDNDVLKVAVREELKYSYEVSTDDLQFVKEEFLAFCRNQEMKNAILESADKLKQEDYEGIRALIEKALKAGQEKDAGLNYKKDVEARYRDDYRPTIPTPWQTLSDLFSGGFGPGDLFLIFGSPGGGKSWLCIDIAAEAAKLGYNVFYYTLELSEKYVSRRIDAAMTGYCVDDLREHRAEVDKMVEELPGNIIIKEYAPKSATISTIKAHVQQCIEDGIRPDLIIIDYIDYLKPSSKVRYSERKDEVDDVYIGSKALAKELQVPVLSPSQVNRMGAKDTVVEGDKAAGSYDKMMVADGSFSLSRTKEDKVLGTGRIHIMKNRFGPDGITYGVKLDTANGHMEFDAAVSESTPEHKVSNSPALNLNSSTLKAFFAS